MSTEVVFRDEAAIREAIATVRNDAAETTWCADGRDDAPPPRGR